MLSKVGRADNRHYEAQNGLIYSVCRALSGSYPERPQPREYIPRRDDSRPVFIGGNEGLAEVEHVPEGLKTSLSVGDWGASPISSGRAFSQILLD